jgi:hypothetical protein
MAPSKRAPHGTQRIPANAEDRGVRPSTIERNGWASCLTLREGRIGCGAHSARYLRSDRKLARISSENSCGCSQAAKWPPRSSLL